MAVLHSGRMEQYDKGATIGIDHGMAFASHGLLACVVTTRSACFGGLHALAVDDCRGWCWFSPCPDAIDPNEMMIEAFEYPIVAQGAEPLVYRAPWRKTVGQKPPGTSCPSQIENGFDDFAHRPASPSSALAGSALGSAHV